MERGLDPMMTNLVVADPERTEKTIYVAISPSLNYVDCTTNHRYHCHLRIGTNLYLAKIALDIIEKHAPDYIGELNERSYCKKLWMHRPLTDFWRVGSGTARRLEKVEIFTMGHIAATDEAMLYRLFGIDAELLIDHAWGKKITTIADIKAYRPKTNSISSGQVLTCDYDFEDG